MGVLEVKDSRGVAHCEEAVKRHKQRKERNKTRALLCISPETIRLVKVSLTYFTNSLVKVLYSPVHVNFVHPVCLDLDHFC